MSERARAQQISHKHNKSLNKPRDNKPEVKLEQKNCFATSRSKCRRKGEKERKIEGERARECKGERDRGAATVQTLMDCLVASILCQFYEFCTQHKPSCCQSFVKAS